MNGRISAVAHTTSTFYPLTPHILKLVFLPCTFSAGAILPQSPHPISTLSLPCRSSEVADQLTDICGTIDHPKGMPYIFRKREVQLQLRSPDRSSSSTARIYETHVMRSIVIR